MLAEACGNRTHLARVECHAGFEEQEGHQAQSASDTCGLGPTFYATRSASSAIGSGHDVFFIGLLPDAKPVIP